MRVKAIIKQYLTKINTEDFIETYKVLIKKKLYHLK